MKHREIKGTWEEILGYASDLEGHLLSVTILDETTEPESPDRIKEKRLKAFQTFASAPLFEGSPLSDQAMSRESIYA